MEARQRPFWVRISEHVKAIRKDNNVPIANHVHFHNRDLKAISFYPLNHIHTGIPGGDIDTFLLQIETRWIYNLQATKYAGLNSYIVSKVFSISSPFSPHLLVYWSVE